MTRFRVLLAVSVAVACEDEPPAIPRGGGEPPAAEKPAAAAAAADVSAPAAAPADAGGVDAGPVPDVAAVAPADVVVEEVAAVAVAAPDVAPAAPRPPRLASASELLGLGDGGREESVTALPAFLRERPAGAAELLFEGNPSEPSSQYAGMAGEVLPVSPLERQWGAASEMSEEEKRRRELLKQSMGDDPGAGIFNAPPAAEAPPTEDEPAEPKGAELDLPYEVIMYKLGPKGEVQAYERRFASREAKEAGERYARGLGFKANRPTEEEIAAAKAKLTAAAAAEKAAPAADACPFRAAWTEAGVQKSMCFPTQAAFDAFNRARQAAQEAPKAPAPAPAPGGIQPVKIGP